MVIAKKWKIVGGGLSVAVALETGAAVAAESSGDAPELDDVVTLQQVDPPTHSTAGDGVVSATHEGESLDSPFGATAEGDDPTPDESPVGAQADSVESPESPEGPDTPTSPDTPESPESADTPQSPDTPASPDSPESPESADSVQSVDSLDTEDSPVSIDG